MNRGKLYVVATPIGNLEDMTLRAIRVLKEVDLIAAEDTRQTRKLLNAYDIHTSLTSLHEHNEQRKSGSLIARLEAGDDVAYVSDAGTPGISDPGYRLIRAAITHDIPVVPVPGVSARHVGVGFDLHQQVGFDQGGDLDHRRCGPNLAEELRMRRADRPPLRDVGDEHAGADHVGHGRAQVV